MSAAQPAPQESTLPTPYQTPGLDGASDAAAGDVAAAAPADPPVFAPRGAVYGAAPGASVVTLQARKAALLVVHRPDGSVFFAQQMKAGEAYRAPPPTTA